MTQARRQLRRITAQLKHHLMLQKSAGIDDLSAADPAARAAWAARIQSIEARRVAAIRARLKADLDAPAPSSPRRPQPPATTPTPAATQAQPAPARPPIAQRFEQASKPAAKPAPASLNAGGAGGALWKTLGSRPAPTLRKPASTPKSSAAPPPDRAPPIGRPPSAPAPAPVQSKHDARAPEPASGATARPAFQEVRHHVEREDPPQQRRHPVKPGSLFEDDRSGPRPLRGFDDTADASQKLQDMDQAQKLDFLRACLGDCTRCKLHQHRKHIVFGDGSPGADLVFVGEGPGYYEDQQGKPFVGKSGQLLNKMIGAMGTSREDVYIANVVKCRPPDNRDPEVDEIRQCSPFLYKQLETVNPRAIITLGRFATQCLLDTKDPMKSLRGKWQDWRGVPVMPTYHPAYLLRNGNAKRDAWNDLQLVMKMLGLDG